jgi:hypothetical protein
MFKKIFTTLFNCLIYFSNAQDCIIEVPNNALNKGLFKTWFVSTSPNSLLPCSQLIEGAEVFIEVTIFDIDNNRFYVYNPLVIDSGTVPAIAPDIGTLPVNNVVVIHFGTNAESITLVPDSSSSSSSGPNSLKKANCVNGLPNGSIFGQFAYCNAVNFFKVVNNNINLGLLSIQSLGNTKLGEQCPSVRSFSIVDQDQSDNVITEYVITTDSKLAQNTPGNRNILKGMKIVKNGSDNKLLTDFINPSIGCISLTGLDLVDKITEKSTLALNELQAVQQIGDVAIIPPTDPMVLDNDQESLTKTNLYRVGVNQPILLNITKQEGINYCNNMQKNAINFFINYNTDLSNYNSPSKKANNLLNFLSTRYITSWSQLNCQNLTGNPSKIQVFTDPNTEVVVSNNIDTLQQIMPSTTQQQFINLCGNLFTNVSCIEQCPNGLDGECVTPDFKCFKVSLATLVCNDNNYCGNQFNYLSCNERCINGLDSECVTTGFKCFKDDLNMCLLQKPTTPTPFINTTTSDNSKTSDSSNNLSGNKTPNSSSTINNNYFEIFIFILSFFIF